MADWILSTEYIEPTELTGLIRQALADQTVNRFNLARWLPNVEVDDIAFEFVKGGGGLSEASSYRSWDTESKVGRREGIGKIMGELPPISEKIPLGEYDRLRLRKLDTNDDRVLRLIARDADRLARNIAARFELARGAALFDAELDLPELQTTVAFGRDPSMSVVAATLWADHANATPLDDYEAWVMAYEDLNGETPGAQIMSKSVRSNLRQCEQVIRQVYPLAPSSAPMINDDQLNTVLSSLGLPPIEINDARTNVAGVATRITPANALLLLPAPGATAAGQPTDLGATLLGTTAEALEPDYGIAPGDQPGVVAAQFKTRDPIRLWTHAAAIGAPIVREPNLTMRAQVLA
ncbi:major capsid protein [Streptomyces misionensis]|uniref:major capsid protein n=1 Tax=Streptomyces misionensis TaxID=67331 RepID=UPI00368B3755